MAKDRKRVGPNRDHSRMAAMKRFVRAEGLTYLRDPNITSVGIGYKETEGEMTGELSIQFTVGSKRPKAELEALKTTMIPEFVQVDGERFPTDVVERTYRPSFELISPEEKDRRKTRLPTLAPGISVSHPSGTAGTLGVIVYDKQSGARCMLSNWHVLHTSEGHLGDTVVQPGPYDDNRVAQNGAGVLLRSFLGLAGDCAVARIEGRGAAPSPIDLKNTPKRLAKPALGDHVVKSGRTTQVTFGIVRRIDVVTKMSYEGLAQEQQVGCFEIGIDPARAPAGGEVSMGGDSGSAWFIAENGKATDIMAGLHFAGEGAGNPDEFALACYAHAVFEKLEISFNEPAVPVPVQPDAQAIGYDPNFVGKHVPAPRLNAHHRADAFMFQGGTLIPYTHYSVCLSKSRRFARFVAWNIDGAQLRSISRKGIPFIKDPRIPANLQVGDELYNDNKLDRGHVARRADLVWGPLAEAKRANIDSFFFTNMTPQHQGFNQSERGGIWGRLENAIFADTEVEKERISVIGGPVLADDDPEYRNIQIPREFWKLVAYVDSADSTLKAKAFVLTQRNLLSDIEAFELDAFRVFQVSLTRLAQLTGLGFQDLQDADAYTDTEKQHVEAAPREGVREIASINDW